MGQHSSIDHTGLTGVSTLSFGSNSNSVAIANAPGASPSNSRADHVHLGVTSIAHSSNTFSGPVILTTPGNTVGITSPTPGTLALNAVGSGGGAATLSYVDCTLSGDVTMTTANTFYDGPSGSFVAGTWLFTWKLVILPTNTSATHEYGGKLWDGSTVYDESSMGEPTSTLTVGFEVSGFAVVVLGSTTTVKISAVDIRNGSTIKRDVVDNSGASHTASRLTGIKIA